MYKIITLDNTFAAYCYQSFTFPAFRPKLLNYQFGGSTLAVAATSSQEPLGLAMAEIQPNSHAEILSIFVTPSRRNQGIGTNLLDYLLDELKQRACKFVKLVYVTGKPTTPALERILNKFKWTSPQARMLVAKCELSDALKVPWLQKEYRLPQEFIIFPWQDIKIQERIALQKQLERESWIPSDLNPLKHEKNSEPLNSLGLRYQDEVVGWVITHRLSPTTIRYSCSYMRPELQKIGRILPLYAKSIKNQAARPDISQAIWTVPYAFPSMICFVKKRMAPYLTSLEESRGTFKTLGE